jgi:hypothetical protein
MVTDVSKDFCMKSKKSLLTLDGLLGLEDEGHTVV